MAATDLLIENLYYNYRYAGEDLPVLQDINIQVNKGEFVCVIGPSGCGKSTLFNVLVGLERPDRGKIILEKGNITGKRGYIAYMPQRSLLFPWRNLMENVILGAEISGKSIELTRREAGELLPLFGLEGFAEAMPDELSGGMRQRAALLRTVLAHREIMALDEPFGALDALTRKRMQAWLLKIWQRLGLTILFITHDIEEAILLADKIYVLSGRPGQIIEEMGIKLTRPRDTINQDFAGLKSHLLDILITDNI
jgi:ABC-type nitrate/sulfonate/bicarbonate transport system ATPase subunit